MFRTKYRVFVVEDDNKTVKCIPQYKKWYWFWKSYQTNNPYWVNKHELTFDNILDCTKFLKKKSKRVYEYYTINFID